MKSKVAVLKTQPERVLDDYKKLMHLAEYEKFISKESEVALKLNISWGVFYPACSTTPWQIDGVVNALLDDGYDKKKLYACHNKTVVVSAKKGEMNNKHKNVIDKHSLRNIHLYEGEEWIKYEPKHKMLVLDNIFPEGIYIPKRFIGDSVIHFPTMKTHVFTTMTGAMKNAFGGLLHQKRHWTHSVIHETLVDLLTIQKEIHPGVFAVMDGTFAGDGPGPRAMVPFEKDFILASGDQVAIDAVAAKMMGFDPMSLKFIRLAHEAGLGCGDPAEIEMVGDDISEVNFGFTGHKNTLASRGQKLIYWGPLKPLEPLLLRTFITPWSYLASWLYHDVYWYPLIGKGRVKRALETKWGKLFQQY
jgi:uncharacterized protein (DUF362 family)